MWFMIDDEVEMNNLKSITLTDQSPHCLLTYQVEIWRFMVVVSICASVHIIGSFKLPKLILISLDITSYETELVMMCPIVISIFCVEELHSFWLDSWLRPFIWSLHILLLLAWVLSGYFGFHLLQKTCMYG